MSASISTAEKARGEGKFATFMRWVLAIMCVPGGMLWALSPLGVTLSESQFKTPDVFWKLFPAAPLLMLAGLVGMRLWRMERPGLWERIAFFAAIAGIVMVVAGDVGKFYFMLDDEYFLMSAPAYRTMRLGFIVLTASSMLLGVFGARSGRLRIWAALPFAICSLAGLVAVVKELGSFGAALWIAFGVGWAWLGLSLFVEGVVSFVKDWRLRRRKKS